MGRPIEPLTGAGSAEVQQKERIRLQEMIDRVNDLFEGELTEGDKLLYVNDVIKGKLLESSTLREQAMNNSKEQFAGSPDLARAIVDAIMEALDAHTAMSTQALASKDVQRGLKDVLLDHAGLYEGLRKAGGAA
jgi:type I restriction enzyme R subunit